MPKGADLQLQLSFCVWGGKLLIAAVHHSGSGLGNSSLHVWQPDFWSLSN